LTFQVIFSPEAETQLIEVTEYIAENGGKTIASNFARSIVDFCMKLEMFPNRGTLRNDLRPGMRLLGFRRRVSIAFSVDDESVTILAIFYGGQDIAAAFERH
jgi:toxin ParE1/3/4